MAKTRKRESPRAPRGQEHNIPASQGAPIERGPLHAGERREAAESIPGRSGEPPPADEPAPSSPDPDRIARRAYELYQARGGSEGGALDDWLAAEQELNAPDDKRSRD